MNVETAPICWICRVRPADIAAHAAAAKTLEFNRSICAHCNDVATQSYDEACKLNDDGINVDLRSFSAALMEGAPHPEVTLLVVNSLAAPGKMLSYQSDVSLLRDGAEVQSALWMHLVHPVGIKVCYVKAGVPVRLPQGFPWHPTRQRKIVKISPYKGDTEPLVARRDLRI